jgi:hypothetical protein
MTRRVGGAAFADLGAPCAQLCRDQPHRSFILHFPAGMQQVAPRREIGHANSQIARLRHRLKRLFVVVMKYLFAVCG